MCIYINDKRRVECGCSGFVFWFKFVPFWISWFSLGAGELSERSSRFSHFVYFRVSVNGSTLYVRFTVLKFGFRCSCYSLKPKYLRGVLWVSLHFFFSWLGHDLGRELDPNLVGLNGAQREESGPREKNLFDKRAAGLDPRVGSRYEKTRPKPDRLPFLVMRGKLVIRQGGADLASTVKTILVTKWRKKKYSLFSEKTKEGDYCILWVNVLYSSTPSTSPICHL